MVSQFGVGGGTFGLKVGVLLQFPIRSLINHGMVNVDVVLEVIERGFGVFWKGLLRGEVLTTTTHNRFDWLLIFRSFVVEFY